MAMRDVAILAATGLGLAEAKHAVEWIELGLEPMLDNPTAKDAPHREALVSLLRAGRKIEAIKLYRAHTGAGLKEAKDAVEGLGISPVDGPSKGGCLGVLILLLVTAGLVASL